MKCQQVRLTKTMMETSSFVFHCRESVAGENRWKGEANPLRSGPQRWQEAYVPSEGLRVSPLQLVSEVWAGSLDMPVGLKLGGNAGNLSSLSGQGLFYLLLMTLEEDEIDA